MRRQKLTVEGAAAAAATAVATAVTAVAALSSASSFPMVGLYSYFDNCILAY